LFDNVPNQKLRITWWVYKQELWLTNKVNTSFYSHCTTKIF
jgi:hypothetical protein